MKFAAKFATLIDYRRPTWPKIFRLHEFTNYKFSEPSEKCKHNSDFFKPKSMTISDAVACTCDRFSIRYCFPVLCIIIYIIALNITGAPLLGSIAFHFVKLLLIMAFGWLSYHCFYTFTWINYSMCWYVVANDKYSKY